jgi:hypothetical protein
MTPVDSGTSLVDIAWDVIAGEITRQINEAPT